MIYKSFFDQDTATFTYVVYDDVTKKAAVIDSVLNFDIFSGIISTTSADGVILFIKQENLELVWILETHIHADHLTAASYIKDKCGGEIAIGAAIKDVLKTWVPILNIEEDTDVNASQFDKLLDDGEILSLGHVKIKVMHTPGHTPACVSYLIDDTIFTGDTIFMPDIGTARCDFPGGSAKDLYASICKIYQLPENMNICVGHDYPPKERDKRDKISIVEQKKQNILIKEGTIAEAYIEDRNKRDMGKPVPRLLYPSIQFNLRAGKLGHMEKNGMTYFKIPVKFGP
jgi:glyoxylase-like metal-dependent hydrolase (beta-lactamase superfamily II)